MPSRAMQPEGEDGAAEAEGEPETDSDSVPAPIAPGSDGSCPVDRKLCGGKCVSNIDAAYGCSPTTCSPCKARDGAIAACKAGACTDACKVGSVDEGTRCEPMPSLALGDDFGCALRTNGELACWGTPAPNLDFGQTRPPAGTFVAVAAGFQVACALAADGTPTCWGKLGASVGSPPAVKLRSVTLAANDGFACGITLDGDTVCWGPKVPQGRPAVTLRSVSAGSAYACGIKTSGEVVCWGANAEGRTTPPAGSFRSVRAGFWHACGVRDDGTAVCWGSNQFSESDPPSGDYRTIAIAADVSCGLRTDGTLAGWGASNIGAPPQGGFRSVALRPYTGCAVKTSDSSIACWGESSFGLKSPPSGTFR